MLGAACREALSISPKWSLWFQRKLSFHHNSHVTHFADGHYLGTSIDLQSGIELRSFEKKNEIKS